MSTGNATGIPARPSCRTASVLSRDGHGTPRWRPSSSSKRAGQGLDQPLLVLDVQRRATVSSISSDARRAGEKCGLRDGHDLRRHHHDVGDTARLDLRDHRVCVEGPVEDVGPAKGPARASRVDGGRGRRRAGVANHASGVIRQAVAINVQ